MEFCEFNHRQICYEQISKEEQEEGGQLLPCPLCVLEDGFQRETLGLEEKIKRLEKEIEKTQPILRRR